MSTTVVIPADVRLEADLEMPHHPSGIVAFAHGSGSSRFSPRNRFVAERLRAHGHATLLLDLLTRREGQIDEITRHLRFEIGLLASRLVTAIDWLSGHAATRDLAIGLFGASTGAAAALVAAARRPGLVGAVVSRGGRADLALDALSNVQAPTLLLVGSLDQDVLTLNREAALHMTVAPKVEVVAGATHLFEEPGTLEQVADLAAAWFDRYLRSAERDRQAVV